MSGGGIMSWANYKVVASPASDTTGKERGKGKQQDSSPSSSCFQMPLHYPPYTRADYETMPEWKLNCLFVEYGLPVTGDDVDYKRKFAIGAFLWPTAH